MKRAEEDGDNTPAEDASGRAADAAEATEAAAEATSNSQPAQPSPTRSSSRRSNGSTSNSPSPRKKQPNGSPKRARPQPNSNHVVRPTRPLRREEEAAGVETAPSSPDSLLEIPLSETPSSGGVVAGDPCCLLSSDHSRSPSEAADDAGNANAADEAEGSAQDGAGDGDGPGDSEPEMPPMEVEGGGGSVQGNTVSDDAAEAVADAEGAAAVNGPDLSKIEYKVRRLTSHHLDSLIHPSNCLSPASVIVSRFVGRRARLKPLPFETLFCDALPLMCLCGLVTMRLLPEVLILYTHSARRHGWFSR